MQVIPSTDLLGVGLATDELQTRTFVWHASSKSPSRRTQKLCSKPTGSKRASINIYESVCSLLVEIYNNFTQSADMMIG